MLKRTNLCGHLIHTRGWIGMPGPVTCAERLPCQFHTKGPDGLSHTERELRIANEPLLVGDKVNKKTGYKFPGIIVSVFKTSTGEERFVVEMDEYHLLHIFNRNQLIKDA